MIRMFSLVTAVALLATVPTYAKRIAPKPAEPVAQVGVVQGIDKEKKTITVATSVIVTKFVPVTKKIVKPDGTTVDVTEMVPTQSNELVTIVYDLTKSKFSDLEGTAMEWKDALAKIEKGDSLGIATGGKLGDVTHLKERKVKVVLYPALPEPK